MSLIVFEVPSWNLERTTEISEQTDTDLVQCCFSVLLCPISALRYNNGIVCRDAHALTKQEYGQRQNKTFVADVDAFASPIYARACAQRRHLGVRRVHVKNRVKICGDMTTAHICVLVSRETFMTSHRPPPPHSAKPIQTPTCARSLTTRNNV